MFDVEKMLKEAREKDRARGISIPGESAYGGALIPRQFRGSAYGGEVKPRQLTPSTVQPESTSEKYRRMNAEANKIKQANWDARQSERAAANALPQSGDSQQYMGQYQKGDKYLMNGIYQRADGTTYKLDAQNSGQKWRDNLNNSKILNTAQNLMDASKSIPANIMRVPSYLINQNTANAQKAQESQEALNILTQRAMSDKNVLGSKEYQDAIASAGQVNLPGQLMHNTFGDYNTVQNAVDALDAQAQAGSARFLEGKTGFAKDASELALGAINLGGTLAVSTAAGVPYLAVMSAQSGAQAGQAALDRGESADTAAALAAGSGAITAGIESFGGIGGSWGNKAVQKLLKTSVGQRVLSSVPKALADKIAALAATKLGTVLGSAASEGAEEFAEYYTQAAFNNLIADTKTPTDVREALQTAKIAGLLGVFFGSAKAFAPRPLQSTSSTERTSKQEIAPIPLKGASETMGDNSLNEKVKGAIPDIISVEPVSTLTGNEFPKSGRKLTEQVGDFFRSLGNKVNRQGFGEVVLNERGVQDSIAHGLGRQKAVTFAAVPDIIKYGREIDFSPNWKGRGYDTHVFAAPVKIADDLRIVASVVIKEPATGRYYLHEVFDETGEVLYKQKNIDMSFKTGTIPKNRTPGDTPMLNNIMADLGEEINSQNTDNVAQPFGKNTVGSAESGFPYKQQTSHVRSNTIENSPMFNQADRELLNSNEFQYDVVTEKQSMAEAAQRLQVDFEGEVQDLPSKAIFDGTDIDTAMGILERYKNEARGKPADSPEAQRLIQWAKMVQKKGTEAGQRIQAFAKYSRTPEGAAVKSEKAISDAWEAYKKSNPKAAKELENFAGTLDKIAQEYNAEVEVNPGAAAEKLNQALQKAMEMYKGSANVGFADRIRAAIESNRKGKDSYLDIIKEFEGIPTLSDEDIINIMDIFEQAEGLPPFSRQRAEIENRAYKIVADKFDSSFMDKLTAWRYMSMLANPTTHIRNTVGNFVFGGVTRIKNDVGALIEGVVKPELRTKALLTLQDKALINAAKADYENYYSLVSSGGKYNPSNQIRDQQTIFKTKALEAIRKKNFELLEAEDNLALKTRYAENLSRFLKANNLNPNVLSAQNLDNRTQNLVDTARVYAAEQAQKATFRDQSQLANWISRLSQTNTAAHAITEGIMPFKKTPINILKRGVEYSPIGLAKGIGDAFSAVKTGRVTATQAIDEISAGLTGSAILALGAYLASAGLIRASDDEDKNQRALDQLTGQQSYSLVLGNKSYTLDWLSPAAMPLLAGVELYKSMSNNGEDSDAIGQAVDALAKIGEPVLEMTLLKGLNSTIQQAAYSQTNPVTGIVSNAVANYAGQMVPTALGKIASSVDPMRRTTFVPSGSPFPEFQRVFQSAQRKIPFASQGLQPYVDRWGRTQENTGGSFLGRLAVNTLSPGYYSEINQTTVDNALQEVYLATGNADVIPKAAPKSINYKGEKIALNGDQYTQFQTTRGQTYYRMLDSFVSSPMYSTLSDEDKSAVMKSMNEFSYETAKLELIPNYEPDSSYKKASDAFAAGITATDYYLYKRFASDATADKDSNNKTIADSRKNKIISYLNRQSLTEAQRNYLLGLEYKLSNENSASNNRGNFKPIPLR